MNTRVKTCIPFNLVFKTWPSLRLAQDSTSDFIRFYKLCKMLNNKDEK